MIDFISKDRYCFEDLVRLVHLLRAPGGCPWDGAQTHESIRRNFLEEAYEVCEAFDRAEAKAMLVSGVLEHFPEKYLVAGSGLAGLGSANTIQTRRVSQRFYLCGDGTSDSSVGLGLVASRVLVCAAHEANMILRLIAGEREP